MTRKRTHAARVSFLPQQPPDRQTNSERSRSAPGLAPGKRRDGDRDGRAIAICRGLAHELSDDDRGVPDRGAGLDHRLPRGPRATAHGNTAPETPRPVSSRASAQTRRARRQAIPTPPQQTTQTAERRSRSAALLSQRTTSSTPASAAATGPHWRSRGRTGAGNTVCCLATRKQLSGQRRSTRLVPRERRTPVDEAYGGPRIGYTTRDAYILGR